MLKKRIISCLDIKDGRTVKGTKFINLKDAGDPLELALRYLDQGIDELVFLDISASNENRKTLITLVEKIAKVISIPFTVGGGIASLEDARHIMNAGADKISLNTSAASRPDLITEISEHYGNQSVVVAIDAKSVSGKWKVFTHGGKVETSLEASNWARQAEFLGAGEILLTSMDQDGVKNGYAINLTQMLSAAINIPVIASGGAGSAVDFKNLFHQTQCSAALAAGIFHSGELTIPDLKNYLKTENISVR